MKKKRMKWADHFKWKDIVEKAKSISELQRHRRRKEREGEEEEGEE